MAIDVSSRAKYFLLALQDVWWIDRINVYHKDILLKKKFKLILIAIYSPMNININDSVSFGVIRLKKAGLKIIPFVPLMSVESNNHS